MKRCFAAVEGTVAFRLGWILLLPLQIGRMLGMELSWRRRRRLLKETWQLKSAIE
jgi:hypothetical protein